MTSPAYDRNRNTPGTLSYFLDLVCKGIGYHHAGMDLQDRKNIEEAFAAGSLPVLGMDLLLFQAVFD